MRAFGHTAQLLACLKIPQFDIFKNTRASRNGNKQGSFSSRGPNKDSEIHHQIRSAPVKVPEIEGPQGYVSRAYASALPAHHSPIACIPSCPQHPTPPMIENVVASEQLLICSAFASDLQSNHRQPLTHRSNIGPRTKTVRTCDSTSFSPQIEPHDPASFAR